MDGGAGERALELLAQRARQALERLLHFRRQGEIGGQQIARPLPQPFPFAAPAGQDVDDVDVGLRQPGKIIGAQLAPVILVEALLGDVGADQIGELGLL